MNSVKNFSGNLKNRISNLLLKESSSDVQFLVGIPPKRYHCHKLILAAGSEVFEAMFYGTLQQKSPVRVPDVEPQGFALMLQYLYSDTVSMQDIFEAFDTAYASKKYIVDGLFTFCEDYLLDKVSLSPETVFFILEGASFLEMKKLHRRCLLYVSRNAREIFLSGSYIMASKDVFEDVLKTDLMDVESEMEIIEALWSWGRERCRDKGIECSAENVRDFTDELLEHVRFSTLTSRELAIAFQKFQLLDTASEMVLLWNLAMPKGRKPVKVLPNICSESRTSRCLRDCPKVQLPGQYQYNGNMTTFTIENHRVEVEMTVSGPPVTLIGVVIAFRPIPCYSLNDRSLKVKLVANNITTSTKFHAKSTFKAECDDEVHQILLLEEFLLVEEDHVASVSLTVSGEGVKLMQLTEEALRYDLGQSKIFLKFDKCAEQSRKSLPMKELMVV